MVNAGDNSDKRRVIDNEYIPTASIGNNGVEKMSPLIVA